MRKTLLACFVLGPFLSLAGCSSDNSGGAATTDGGTSASNGSDSSAPGNGSVSDGGSSKDSGPGSGNGSSTGSVGAVCTATSQCASGLTCDQSGFMTGRCTADCSANYNLCASQFGASTLCMNGSRCAQICTGGVQCPGDGVCVPLSSGQYGCEPNPNGPPDAAAPPNGACTNLGGAFGDTVANGAYRCSFDTSAGPSTSMDKCENGTWVAAYTCSCLVQGAASDCIDFQAAGTAQCSYGAVSCAQCDPTTGCAATP
jgi:hypothetical protein